MPATAAITAPPVVVLRREPEEMEEMAKEEVVACEVVAFSAVRFWKVEEAVARTLAA